jgi:hypothetical protein
MNREINFHYCHILNDDDMPLAIARFTAYDDQDQICAVSQITYEDNSDYFQSEVSIALKCGVDVSILAPAPLSDFQELQELVSA